MADFRDKLKSALLYTSDYAAGQTGEKQNLYGTYQEQKTKREEAEAKRLQMEREAALAQQKLQYETLKNIAGAKPTQQMIAGYDASGTPSLIQNPGYDALFEQRKAEKEFYAKKGLLPATRESLVGMNPMQIRDEMRKRSSGPTGQRYVQPELPGQAITPQEKDQIRRSFTVGGGFIAESELDSFKERSGIDARNLAKTLGLEKITEGGKTGYSFPPDALARPLLSAKGQEALIRAKKEAGGAGAEAGRIVLAQESLDGIDKIKSIVFPKGTPDSVNWGALFKSNIMGKAVPRDYEGQTIKRLTKTMLSGRQLIQTGVAARPDETEALWDNFAANIMSNPKAASEAYDQLFKFYEGYLNVNDPQGVFREKILGGKKKQSAGVNLDELF